MRDVNAGITAEKERFSHAFTTLYGSNLTYRPGRVVRSVSAIAGRFEGSVVVDMVVTDALGQAVVMGTETCDAPLLNGIPPHRLVLEDEPLVPDADGGDLLLSGPGLAGPALP